MMRWPLARQALLVVVVVLFVGCLADPGPAPTTSGNAHDTRAPNGPMNVEVAAFYGELLKALRSGKSFPIDAFSAEHNTTHRLSYYATGNHTQVPRPKQTFRLVLSESNVVTTKTWAELDGTRITMPFVEVFEGHVEDSPDELARVVVTKNWARAAVRTDEGRLHLMLLNHTGYRPPEQGVARTDPGPAPSSEEDVSVRGLTGVGSCGPEPPLQLITGTGRMARPELRLDLIMDADQFVFDRYREDTIPLLVAYAAEGDLVYHHQLSIRFNLVGLHVHSKDYYSSAGSAPDFIEARTYWNARDIDRDVVFVLNGFPSAGGYGQAYCVGAAGIPDASYATGTLDNARECCPGGVMLVMSHEIGHLFNAHHHYGNNVEANDATVMIAGYTPGMDPVFGTLERSHIRSWAETYLVDDASPRQQDVRRQGATDVHSWPE